LIDDVIAEGKEAKKNCEMNNQDPFQLMGIGGIRGLFVSSPASGAG
jgi:hypothetical protein